MHSAPSVSYPVGRSRFAGTLLLLAWLLGAGVIGMWGSLSPSSAWRLWSAWAVLAAAGASAAWNWWRCEPGVLAWDGENWSWSVDGAARTGMVEVSLDLQHWLLLRWNADDATHWLWIERTGLAERWDDLRRAVYSRARPQALRRSRAPAAKP